MGSSFVKVRDQGLWVKDSMLELWLRLLALHVEDNAHDPSHPSHAIREQWLMASRGWFNGCCPDGLNEAVSTPQGTAVTKKAIVALLESLTKVSPAIDNEAFNLLGFQAGDFVKGSFETWRLVEVSEVMLDLIDGKVGNNGEVVVPMLGDGEKPEDRVRFYAKR